MLFVEGPIPSAFAVRVFADKLNGTFSALSVREFLSSSTSGHYKDDLHYPRHIGIARLVSRSPCRSLWQCAGV